MFSDILVIINGFAYICRDNKFLINLKLYLESSHPVLIIQSSGANVIFGIFYVIPGTLTFSC